MSLNPANISRDYRVKPESLPDDEYRLRRLIFMQHSNPECMLYGDDGELSCNSCDIDFMRDTPKEIEDRIYELNMLKMIKQHEANNDN